MRYTTILLCHQTLSTVQRHDAPTVEGHRSRKQYYRDLPLQKRWGSHRADHHASPTKYLLDHAGLTQVLNEFSLGCDTYYLIGMDVIGQQTGSVWSFFSTDTLGSMRQFFDNQWRSHLRRQPLTFGVPITSQFGAVLEQYSFGQRSLGFTDEYTDETGLQYLRAQWSGLARARNRHRITDNFALSMPIIRGN